MVPSRVLAATLLVAGCVAFAPAHAAAQRRGPAPRTRAVVIAGFGYAPFYYDPWLPYRAGWYGPPPLYGQRYFDNSASMRLQVSPKNAEVFIDGYFAGTVDQFDGTFQRLRVEPGQHELVIYAEGFRSFHQRLYLQPVSTFTVKATLEPLRPGERQEDRPSVAPPPPQAGVNPPPPSGRNRNDRPRRVPGDEGRRPGDRGSFPPPTQQASGYGTLALRIQPGGAEVRIDGERWEVAGGEDRLVIQLASGPHQVDVRRDGYEPFSRTIEIRPGETEVVNIGLTRR